jgi:hypothetical protein
MERRWLFRFTKGISRWLRPFVELREGFLVVVACLYGLGYITWSIYAIKEGLGLLPLLSTQYILAGAVMGVFLVVAWESTTGLWKSRARFHLWLGSTSTSDLWVAKSHGQRLSNLVASHKAMIRQAMGGIMVVSFIATYLIWFELTEYEAANWFFMLAFAIVAFYTPGNWWGRFWGFLFSLAIPLFSLVLAVKTFLFLPEQFGGPHSSCSYLDIDRTMISKELQGKLLPTGDGDKEKEKVVRTVALDVLFSGGDSIQVRPHAAEEAPTHHSPIFAISSKLVTATVDCEQPVPGSLFQRMLKIVTRVMRLDGDRP